MEEIQMKCIWTNPQNIGLAGHWRIINEYTADRL